MFSSFRLFVLVCFTVAYYYATTDPEPQRIKARRAKRAAVAGPPANRCNNAGDIAITFDEGPQNSNTPLVLDALDASNTKATFHISTQYLNQQLPAAIVRRIYGAGHVIGLRYMPSGRLSTMNVDQVKTEVVEQAEIIKRLIGVYPRYIRLPFGEVSAEVETAIYSMGYVSTYWNIDSADYRACQNIHGYTGADMVGAYTREFQAYRNAGNLKGAFIALQHDSCPIGPYVRDVVKACGDFEYRIVTMDKCLGHDDPYKYAADSEGIRPTAGNGGTGGSTQNGGTQDNGKQGSQSVGGGSGASSVQVSLSMMVSAVVVGLIGVLLI